MTIYNEKIIYYFENLNHNGEFSADIKNIYTGKAGHERNGDVVQIQLHIENNKIMDAKFKAYGTVVTIAAAAWLTTFVIDKSLEETDSISAAFITNTLSISTLHLYSAVICSDALKQAKRALQD